MNGHLDCDDCLDIRFGFYISRAGYMMKLMIDMNDRHLLNTIHSIPRDDATPPMPIHHVID